MYSIGDQLLSCTDNFSLSKIFQLLPEFWMNPKEFESTGPNVQMPSTNDVSDSVIDGS